MKGKLLLCIFVINIMAFSLFAQEQEYVIKNGDTLSSLLKDYYTPSQILDISKKIKGRVEKFYLKAGNTITFSKDKVVFHISYDKDIVVLKDNNGFNILEMNYSVQQLNYIVSGTIESSLFESIRNAGESDELAIMLANALEWEIDFFKDLQPGDSYTLVVEKKFCRSKFVGYGKILALDFFNKGKLIRAFYYEDNEIAGYYKLDGQSLKRGFLKAPLRFNRISSYFSPNRLHPIFKKRMPHYGVDYAAPTGTPVYATASGVVLERRYRRGNGNYIKIRHTNGYSTYYMHLSRFANIRVGSRVAQGQVIGYVGATGFATGPHLDYRIERYGRFVNPLSFKAPAEKMAQSKIKNFNEKVAQYKNLLDNTYYRYANIRLLM
jgi:murein DD-endopeptidase MepM/ murein hydrolase activator NlpD